jgi:lupus La protein
LQNVIFITFASFQAEGKESKDNQANNKLPKGSVIFFSGVSKTCTREDVKECLDKFDADIAYIDFQRGNTEGWVRLQGENAAKPLLDKTEENKVRRNMK